MEDLLFHKINGINENHTDVLRVLLQEMKSPFRKGDSIGIKLHWGEQGNHSYLPPIYAKEIAQWLIEQGVQPFITDTTVLYSGGRRTGSDAIKTAIDHGYTEEYLRCPIVIADGLDGRSFLDIPAGFKHFESVQVASILEKANGFFVFSHFKGHMLSLFGGAIKNLSMGLSSRAQKQRMHSDAQPSLNKTKCSRCKTCVDICPTGSATIGDDGYPVYDLKKCIGCAQCIGLCPELALKIMWNTDELIFQEKLVETAAAVWGRIKDKSLFINALLNITTECDCMPGDNPVLVPDLGFVGGYHPVDVDRESLNLVGTKPFEQAHPHLPWNRQFEYSREIGFTSI